jgi:hypothetical protein
MDRRSGKAYIAIFRNIIVILYPNILSTQVEFSDGRKCLSCELGSIFDFHVIGEL